MREKFTLKITVRTKKTNQNNTNQIILINGYGETHSSSSITSKIKQFRKTLVVNGTMILRSVSVSANKEKEFRNSGAINSSYKNKKKRFLCNKNLFYFSCNKNTFLLETRKSDNDNFNKQW